MYHKIKGVNNMKKVQSFKLEEEYINMLENKGKVKTQQLEAFLYWIYKLYILNVDVETKLKYIYFEKLKEMEQNGTDKIN